MSITTLSSATKEVKIGFSQPFVMIGERINPTGRKILAEEMKVADYSRVEADAIAQVAAGAQMLDVNAGIPLADEPAILAESIRLVQEVVDVVWGIICQHCLELLQVWQYTAHKQLALLDERALCKRFVPSLCHHLDGPPTLDQDFLPPVAVLFRCEQRINR